MFKSRIPILLSLVILSAIICVLVQVLIGVKVTVLNANYYSSIIQKHNLHELPQNYVLLSMKNEAPELLSEPICNALTPAIAIAFSEFWVQYQGENVIKKTLDYVKGDDKKLRLIIPLEDRKVILKDEIDEYLKTKYTANELANFQITSTEETANIMVNNANLPGSIDVAKSLNFAQNGIGQMLDTFRSHYYLIMLAPFLLFLTLIILIVLIGRDGLGVKWLGSGIIMASFFTLLVASASNVFLDEFLIKNISEQNKLLTTIGTNPIILTSIVKNSVISSLNKIALSFCLFGSFLFVGGKLWLIHTIKNEFKL
ncbi:MAG TPA: hypothetical protein VFC73_04665 [Syntrophomonadaceae bacterium]|nr:hypothetical protein [Syntrophomonadaceae bacterium]